MISLRNYFGKFLSKNNKSNKHNARVLRVLDTTYNYNTDNSIDVKCEYKNNKAVLTSELKINSEVEMDKDVYNDNKEAIDRILKNFDVYTLCQFLELDPDFIILNKEDIDDLNKLLKFNSEQTRQLLNKINDSY